MSLADQISARRGKDGETTLEKMIRKKKEAEAAKPPPPEPEDSKNPYTYRRLEAAPKHSAATSHLENDKYMDDWEDAYQKLAAMNCGQEPQNTIEAGGPGGKKMSLAQQIAGPPPLAKQISAARTSIKKQAGDSLSARASGALSDDGEGFDPYPAAVTQGWFKGPTNPQALPLDLSDRPNMCSAANWAKNEIVIGSSDHALYIIDAVKGGKKRTLYNKNFGHSEWVTCCCYTGAGHVVSGGMDSKLWLWPGGVKGVEMEGHSSPISKVLWDASTELVVSASYDKTLRLWDVNGGFGREVACLTGHAAPVLEASANNRGKIVSGDRSGNVIVWDSATGQEVWKLKKKAHAGHVTSLEWWNAEGGDVGRGCFVSGGQDGCVRVFDPREKKLVAAMEIHVNEKGRGATSDILPGGPSASSMLVTAGAEGTLAITDPRVSWSLVTQVKLSNFPYSLAAAGGLALVGLGDGGLWVVRCTTGEVLYALGANKAAVRCIEATTDRMLCSGDDGNSVLYHFN